LREWSSKFASSSAIATYAATHTIILEHQPSLFDGIEKIDESFTPIRGRERAKANGCIKDFQWGWQF
jgi:hypothetical protein